MRPYVYKDQQNYWYCNTSAGIEAAKKTIHTALIARDLIDVGDEIPVEVHQNQGQLTPDDEGFKIYRTIRKVRAKNARTWPQVGDIVLITNNAYSNHAFPNGAVVRVVEGPDPSWPDEHVYAEGPTYWDYEQIVVNHISPNEFMRTDAQTTTSERLLSGDDPYELEVDWEF